MATLELRGLHKVFSGDTPAVRDLDLRVADGEFLVLVGPSGCGKSTVLRLVAGLEAPTRGDILLDRRLVNGLEPRERDVAMVFQNYALYPHMTVAQNIAFPLRMARLDRRRREARVREAAELLGIEGLLRRKPSQLSGGQQQRVALARALVRRPRLFLFDEPLSNVDAKLRSEMRAELARLHRELGATILYVTHDQVEAMTLGSRIAVLEGGVLQQAGPPEEVYRRPANRFVATFIGSPPMNLLRGPVAASLRPPGLAQDCLVGFRPHEVEPEGELEARVDLVEDLGHEVLVHGRVGDEAVVLALRPGALPQGARRVRFAPAPGALHCFDAATGGRLG